ncbi:tetraspanin-2 [Vombatus ursinus]|nr:tetraspanin-2 [Vombatus ursinus]
MAWWPSTATPLLIFHSASNTSVPEWTNVFRLGGIIPDSYKLGFVYRDSKNVAPRGESPSLVTSSPSHSSPSSSSSSGFSAVRLAGSAVIAFGLWLRFGGIVKDLSSEGKTPEYFYMGLYVLVGAGALMMTVGFFGCCGAVRESQCLLGSFFTCLLVIFAAEVTTGVFAFIGKGMAIREVQTMYEEAYNGYLKNKMNKTLITFHSSFLCCGKESPDQVQSTCPKELLGHKNCIDEIENVISAKLQLIAIVGIGIAGVTIFGMIFSMVLCCVIRNSRDVI